MEQFDDFILEQEFDEQLSLCSECGNLHSCSTACWYDEDEYDWEPEAVCIFCGKPIPIEGFCCEPECLESAAPAPRSAEPTAQPVPTGRIASK